MSSSEPLLRVDAVRKSFGTEPVLRDVSLDVPEGRITAIIGASGSGKSTLLRCINALEGYEAGRILLRGHELSYHGPQRRRLGDKALSAQRAEIGMVFQSYNLFPHLTARQNITLGLRRVRHLPGRAAREAAVHWLARVGLADRCDHYPYQLSGGQQQRVAIARAFALQPRLVLLDEVTSALDPELVGEVLAVLRDLARSGMTMLVVSHELAFVREVADQVVFMTDGAVGEIGPPETIFEHPRTPALARFTARLRQQEPIST